jgi:hypothetical protein
MLRLASSSVVLSCLALSSVVFLCSILFNSHHFNALLPLFGTHFTYPLSCPIPLLPPAPSIPSNTSSRILDPVFRPLEPSDPQDAEVANMYLSNYERFASTARFWTESYAMPRAEVAGSEVLYCTVLQRTVLCCPALHFTVCIYNTLPCWCVHSDLEPF